MGNGDSDAGDLRKKIASVRCNSRNYHVDKKKAQERGPYTGESGHAQRRLAVKRLNGSELKNGGTVGTSSCPRGGARAMCRYDNVALKRLAEGFSSLAVSDTRVIESERQSLCAILYLG